MTLQSTRTLDGVDNMLSFSDDGVAKNPVVDGFPNPDDNGVNQYSSFAAKAQVYDDNSALIDNGDLKLLFDHANRLVEVRRKSDNTLVASYLYTADGKRVLKTLGTGAVTRYLRMGWQIIEERNAADQVLRQYVTGDAMILDPRCAIKVIATLCLLTGTSTLCAHGISDSAKESMLSGGAWQYVELDASHMLTGYDHLLFLFGVIFFLTRFNDIVKFITAFTIGHSITLVFATFMGISANYFLVDAVIALTVIYKGFDNLDGFQKFLKMNSPNLIMLVFVFGLVHGFGLSTRLQQLPLGDEGLLLKIISFNVGVECGQVLALTAMLFVLNSWRKMPSFKQFSLASNTILMVAGALLFLMQMHGYSHEVPVDGPSAHMPDTAPPTVAGPKVVGQEQWKDTVTISIPGGKGLEYKFHVKKDDILEYVWETGGAKLFFDFHGEPQGDTTGAFESFKKGSESASDGEFKAPFAGSHGWYWKNKGLQDVKVTLKTRGNYEIIGLR